ncbi:hypothetical protein TNIN_153631, partial [Trichonephila inaurata madagascariensis]
NDVSEIVDSERGRVGTSEDKTAQTSTSGLIPSSPRSALEGRLPGDAVPPSHQVTTC